MTDHKKKVLKDNGISTDGGYIIFEQMSKAIKAIHEAKKKYPSIPYIAVLSMYDVSDEMIDAALNAENISALEYEAIAQLGRMLHPDRLVALAIADGLITDYIDYESGAMSGTWTDADTSEPLTDAQEIIKLFRETLDEFRTVNLVKPDYAAPNMSTTDSWFFLNDWSVGGLYHE